MRLLEKHGIAFEPIPYHFDEADLSVCRIAQLNALPEARIFKTLVVRGDRTGPLVALIAGHCALSFKRLAKLSGNRRMCLVSPDQLQALTGYVRGGCSPLGMRRNLPVFIDRQALAWTHIYVNGGRKGLLLRLSPEALIRLTRATVASIGVSAKRPKPPS